MIDVNAHLNTQLFRRAMQEALLVTEIKQPPPKWWLSQWVQVQR
jgi:hypothetical protein